MTGFYLRWAGMIVIAIILAVLTARHYEQNLASLSPKAVVLNGDSQATLRIQGMVKSGSLTGKPEEGHAEFDLLGSPQA